MNEQKLDELLSKVELLLTGQQILVTRIAQIEEKLVSQPVVISSPITVEDNKDVNVDIARHLHDIVNKEQRRQKSVGVGQEEFNEIDWDKLVNSFGVLPDNSLETTVKKNLLPKVPFAEDKRYITQERDEVEKMKRFGRVNQDGTVEWDEWKAY